MRLNLKPNRLRRLRSPLSKLPSAWVRPLIDLKIESCYDLKGEKYWGWHGRSIDKYRRDYSEDGSDHRTESFDVNQ